MAKALDIEAMSMAEIEALEAKIAARKKALDDAREAELLAELAAIRKRRGRKARGPRRAKEG